MVYVGDVVALGSLCPVVVDDGKQLVAPLLGRVLALGGRTQDFRPDLQVDWKVLKRVGSVKKYFMQLKGYLFCTLWCLEYKTRQTPKIMRLIK